jgi:DNA-binding transcriptional regulator YdaS (Cro superfamily)
MAGAVSKLGSEAKLAAAIGTTQASVWRMLRGLQPVSAETAVALERATGIPRWRFRPDLWPQPLPPDAPATQNEAV